MKQNETFGDQIEQDLLKSENLDTHAVISSCLGDIASDSNSPDP